MKLKEKLASRKESKNQGRSRGQFHCVIIFICEFGVVMSSVALVCVSASVGNAPSFDSLHLESSFLLCRYIFRISRPRSHIKVIGSRSRSKEQNACLCVLFIGGRPLVKRKSCLYTHTPRISQRTIHEA